MTAGEERSVLGLELEDCLVLFVVRGGIVRKTGGLQRVESVFFGGKERCGKGWGGGTGRGFGGESFGVGFERGKRVRWVLESSEEGFGSLWSKVVSESKAGGGRT